ncbi:hypothetical protein CPB86DRAFT_791384, partial [Serendipita vermifera]
WDAIRGSTKKKRQKSENIRTTVHPSDPRPPPPMTISFRVPPAILEFHHEQVNAMNPFDTSNISQNRRRRSLRCQLPSSSMAAYTIPPGLVVVFSRAARSHA